MQERYNGKYCGPGLREVVIDLQYQEEISQPPVSGQELYGRACAGDQPTIETFREPWIKQFKENAEYLGGFGGNSVGQLYGQFRNQPCVVLGAGPSLKSSVDALKENRTWPHSVTSISVLHNFGYLHDMDAHADYYISLDSQEVVLDDIAEGCKLTLDEYFEASTDHILIASTTSPPELLKRWKGKIYTFNVMVPDERFIKETEEVEKFKHYFSTGGNVTGAAIYCAKSVWCADPIIIVGMDMCFDYDNKFHSYGTKYDNWNGNGIGQYINVTDVFGNRRKSYPSYWGFKCFMDDMVCRVPGNFINCSEGILGAYKEGNIRQMAYMPLIKALLPYKISQLVDYQPVNAVGQTIGEPYPVIWDDVWAKPDFDKNILLY